jgi:hypothetical protein
MLFPQRIRVACGMAVNKIRTEQTRAIIFTIIFKLELCHPLPKQLKTTVHESDLTSFSQILDILKVLRKYTIYEG